eukprot:m.111669 g.111669  ORF g.111669 m.111669 type:complete len:159 (-) comp12768_c0_seq1:37-513(-)
MQFQSFLRRAQRYHSLPFLCVNSKGNTTKNSWHSSGKDSKQIVLVEDLPNYLFQRSSVQSFHEMLREYNKTALSPLVFIISDNQTSTTMSAAAFLFPSLQESAGLFDTIKFNAIASTKMIKALKFAVENGKLDVNMFQSFSVDALFFQFFVFIGAYLW